MAIKKKIEYQIDKMIGGLVMSEKDFVKACQVMSKEQYDNMTDERSLFEACGYPMCNKHLTEHTKVTQAYKVTPYHVFKTQERFRFCSDDCYFSSNFVANQLEDHPAWHLLSKPPKSIKLFHHLTSAERACYKLSSAVGFDGKYAQDEIRDILGTIKSSKKNMCLQLVKDSKVSSNDKITEDLKDPEQDIIDRVENVSLEDVGQGKVFKSPNVLIQSMKHKQTSRFEKISKYLREWSDKIDYHRCANNLSTLEEDLEERIEILSIVDCSNVLMLRRSVVKDRLRQAFSSLPNGLSRVVTETRILKLFNDLVKYLEFSNTNILLDSDEWMVVALVLLKLFSTVDDNLKEIHSSPGYSRAIAGFGITPGELQEMARGFTYKDKLMELVE